MTKEKIDIWRAMALWIMTALFPILCTMIGYLLNTASAHETSIAVIKAQYDQRGEIIKEMKETMKEQNALLQKILDELRNK